jgi:hypothetical protein
LKIMTSMTLTRKIKECCHVHKRKEKDPDPVLDRLGIKIESRIRIGFNRNTEKREVFKYIYFSNNWKVFLLVASP